MNKDAAEAAARAFLRSWLDVKYCPDPPPSHVLYFDPSEEYLFEVVLGHPRLGATEYLAVSKTTGKVRYAGAVGE